MSQDAAPLQSESLEEAPPSAVTRSEPRGPLPVGRVLAVSAAAGFAIGAFVRPSWTDNVESAQVLAGLVTYPERTPLYDYHTTVFSLTIQAAALLLGLGLEEWPLSVLFSGLQGALSFGALSLLGLAVSRSSAFALLMPVLFLRLREWSEGDNTYIHVLHGHRYPNVYPNDTGIYGVVGLFCVLLVFALFALRKVGPGALLLGLMPGIHPGLALPCFLGAAAGAWYLGGRRRAWWRVASRPLAVGLGITALGAAYQAAFVWDPAGESAPPARVEEIVQAFLRSWEDHNFLLDEGEAVGFFETEYYTFALGIALLTFLRPLLSRSVRAVVVALLAVASVATAYTLFLNWRPDLVPWQLRTLLVMRWLNLDSFAFPVIGLGVLGYLALRRRSSIAAVVLGAHGLIIATGFTRALTSASGPGAAEGVTIDFQGLLFPVTLVLAACGLPILERTRLALRHPAALSRALAVAALALASGYLWSSHLSSVTTEKLRGKDVHTDVLDAATGRPGLLLVCDALWDVGRVQLRTRRPLLLDPTQLNMMTKVPGSAPRMAEILERVYGVDVIHQGPQESLGERWPEYSIEQWQRIRRELGVTDVLIASVFALPLPKLSEGPVLTLYTIPP